MSDRKLTFKDAIILAKGCHDYNGGHGEARENEIYHHGIQTVVNVLESVQRDGFDSQTAAVFSVGVHAEKAGP